METLPFVGPAEAGGLVRNLPLRNGNPSITMKAPSEAQLEIFL